MMARHTSPPGTDHVPKHPYQKKQDTHNRVPGAGSFIRPGKKPDGERTFLEALKDKYATNYQYEHVVLEASGKEIEMIGFDKVEHQQRYHLIVERSNVGQ